MSVDVLSPKELTGKSVQEVGVDRVVFALHAQPGPLFDHRSGGKLLIRPRADEHSSDRSETLETSPGIDRIAHRWVGDVAVASDLAHEYITAVDTNAHPRPIWAVLGEARNPALQRQRSARRSQRVVGLVSSVVERGHDAVADELIHVPPELTGDQRRRSPPVGAEHGRDLRRR